MYGAFQRTSAILKRIPNLVQTWPQPSPSHNGSVISCRFSSFPLHKNLASLCSGRINLDYRSIRDKNPGVDLAPGACTAYYDPEAVGAARGTEAIIYFR